MTTNNTTTTPEYIVSDELVDSAMAQMDKSTLLINFGALIKAELESNPQYNELLQEYRYVELDSWERQEELDFLKEADNLYMELKSKDFELVSPNENFALIQKNKWQQFPVFAYIHGGMTVSLNPFGCRWDSGRLGYIWAADKDYAEKIIKMVDRLLTGNIKRDIISQCYVDLNGEMI